MGHSLAQQGSRLLTPCSLWTRSEKLPGTPQGFPSWSKGTECVPNTPQEGYCPGVSVIAGLWSAGIKRADGEDSPSPISHPTRDIPRDITQFLFFFTPREKPLYFHGQRDKIHKVKGLFSRWCNRQEAVLRLMPKTQQGPTKAGLGCREPRAACSLS